VLEERMLARTDHYMPASLLESQLATLEQLESDERGMVLRVTGGAPELVSAITRRLN
jgi:gluconokinase